MIIACKICKTNYHLDERVLPETGSLVRCSKCKEVFTAYPPSADRQTVADQPPAADIPDETPLDEVDLSSLDEIFEGDADAQLGELTDAELADLDLGIGDEPDFFDTADAGEAGDSKVPVSEMGRTEAAAKAFFEEDDAQEPVPEDDLDIDFSEIEALIQEDGLNVGDVAADTDTGIAPADPEATAEAAGLADLVLDDLDQSAAAEPIVEEIDEPEESIDAFEALEEISSDDIEELPSEGSDGPGPDSGMTAAAGLLSSLGQGRADDSMELKTDDLEPIGPDAIEELPGDEDLLTLEEVSDVDTDAALEDLQTARLEEESEEQFSVEGLPDVNLEDSGEIDFSDLAQLLEADSTSAGEQFEETTTDAGAAPEAPLQLDEATAFEEEQEASPADDDSEPDLQFELESEPALKLEDDSDEEELKLVLESETEPEPVPAADVPEDGAYVSAEADEASDEEIDFSDLEKLLEEEDESQVEHLTTEAEFQDLDLDLEMDSETQGLDLQTEGAFETTFSETDDDSDDLDFAEIEKMLDEESELEAVSTDSAATMEVVSDEGDLEFEVEEYYEEDETTPGAAIDQSENLHEDIPTETIDMRTSTVDLEKARRAEKAEQRFSEGDERFSGGRDFRTAPRPKSRKSLVALLIIVLVGGLAYGTYLTLNRMNIEIPFVSQWLNPKPDDPAGKLGLTPIENTLMATYLESKEAGTLFVIRGRVKNDYDHSRKNVRITGKLFAPGKKLVKAQTVFCGNLISELDLTALDFATIQQRLKSRGAGNSAKLSVPPEGVIPFMIVFSNLPDDLEEFTIAVDGSEKA